MMSRINLLNIKANVREYKDTPSIRTGHCLKDISVRDCVVHGKTWLRRAHEHRCISADRFYGGKVPRPDQTRCPTFLIWQVCVSIDKTVSNSIRSFQTPLLQILRLSGSHCSLGSHCFLVASTWKPLSPRMSIWPSYFWISGWKAAS